MLSFPSQFPIENSCKSAIQESEKGLLGLSQMGRKEIAKSNNNKKNLFFHSWFTSTLNLLIFMKGKIHESKGSAWLNRRGNEHLLVQVFKRHVLHFYKYFKPISAICNIIKHLQLHSIFNSVNLFSYFPKKSLPNTGPGVTVSKKTPLSWKHGRAWRPPLLCVYYFHNVILSKGFLKITFHSLKNLPASNCF